MQQTWGELLTHDPCYNIHLTRDKEDYSLNLRSPLEVTAVRLTENEDNKLWGCFLDSPQPGYLQGDSLDVIGWVIGKIAPAIAIQVIYNNKIIAQTDIDLHRPDVAQVYPYLPEAGKSGFATTVQLKDLSSYTQLNLQAVLADQTSVPLAKVQLRY